MNEKNKTAPDTSREVRGDKLSVLNVVERGIWICALFFASIALLCWSVSSLLMALRTGPSLETAQITPPIAPVSPVIALMIGVISAIRLHYLEKESL